MKQLKTILLIEDDEITNYLNIYLITQLNISVKLEIRNNGEEALEYIKECDAARVPRPELIFLELQMSFMDGFQFLEEYEQLEEREEKSRIILLTTTEYTRTEMLSLSHKIEKVIMKPLTLQGLWEVVIPDIPFIRKSRLTNNAVYEHKSHQRH